MVFETNENLSNDRVELIERIHEVMINQLEYDTENFEIVPEEEGISVNFGYFPE